MIIVYCADHIDTVWDSHLSKILMTVGVMELTKK